MQLRPGLRLESAACDAQVVVVKAPAGSDLDLRCGGASMREIGASGERRTISQTGEPAQLGKRYEHEAAGLEVLCTRGGDGALTLGETALLIKGAKPLPASD